MRISDVFVSYRRKDIELVERLSAAFAEREREVWLDWEDIPPGVSDFNREIAAGIEGADSFIAVLSPDYLASEYCLNELRYAHELNKRIIPVVYRTVDGIEVPEFIRPINWVYFMPHAGRAYEFASAFEALLRAMDTDHDHVREHTRLLTRASDWENNKRNPSFFLSGDDLDAAEKWLASASSRSPPPADIHTEFILQSRKAQARRQRRLLGGALVLLVLAVAGLVAAVIAGLEARAQQSVAERRAAETLSLATANAGSQAVADGDYFSGFNLVNFASTLVEDPPVQVMQLLRQIAHQPGTRYAFFDGLPDDMNTLGLKRGSSAQSSDQSGTRLVAEDESRFTIRGADDRVLLRLNRLIGPRFLGIPADEKTIRPEILRRYGPPQFGPRAMEPSPDDGFVAVGTEGGLVIVENSASAAEWRRPEAHELPVDGVRYSSDGRYLVSRGSSDSLGDYSVTDREFVVWDTAGWDPVLALTTFGQKRDLVAFSDDGRHLLFLEASPPGYTLWDVGDSRQVMALRASGLVMDVAFSPDGELLVVASLATLRMRPPRDFSIYDDDGRRLVSFGGRPGETAIDMPVSFSADGRKLRAIMDGGELAEIDIRSGAETLVGSIPDLPIEGSSADGRFIAFNDYDGHVVVIWDMEEGKEHARISDDDVGLHMVVSDDGRYLAHSTRKPVAERADLVVRDLSNGGAVVARFDDAGEGAGYVGSVSFGFGPDSANFFYSDVAGNLLAVETDGWRTRSVLRGLSGPVCDVAVSPDGRMLAAAGESGGVLVWDLESGTEVQRIGGGGVAKMGFSPDGGRLVVGDERGRVSLWRLTDSGKLSEWIRQNRALAPPTCDDLVQAGVVASAENCPVAAEDK
jgi:WD40 repeat protein